MTSARPPHTRATGSVCRSEHHSMANGAMAKTSPFAFCTHTNNGRSVQRNINILQGITSRQLLSTDKMNVFILLAAAASTASAFTLQETAPLSTRCSIDLPHAITTASALGGRGIVLRDQKGPGQIERPVNEFSRTYNTDRVLGNTPRQRDYSISVEADEAERHALADRFDLFNIDKLEADLKMRREVQVKGTSSRASGVQVEGNVRARVTQTCVRTNEKFDVDVEFPLFAVVRPVASSSDTPDDDLAELDNYFAEEKRKQKKVRAPDRNINEMDMMELQQMLQDFDVEDDVVEDEAIFARDGIIDVGELVSQLFWLKLDPYPKKPGTGPIQISISG